MKRVLILTYYFPPYTGIEGNRPASWVSDFKNFSLSPVVVTRQWAKGGQKSWQDYIHEFGEEPLIETSEKATIIRLPHRHKPLYKKYKEKFISPLIYWGYKFFGGIHIETDAYYSFKSFLHDYLSREEVDLLLVSSPPLNIVKLGKELSEKFNIPLVVDFRDSYNNNLLKKDPFFNFKEQVEIFLLKTYVSKWLSKASLITGVSEPVLNLVEPNRKIAHQVVLNGFEDSLFKFSRFGKAKKTSQFTITIMGNLYIQQDIDFMIKGFSEFLLKTSEGDVIIQFVGLAGQTAVVEKIRVGLPAGSYLVTDRILRNEALQYLDQANILYYLGWRGYKGIYSGKIFEYLGARKNILIAPNDFDVLDDLIERTGAGKLAETPEVMAQILLDWYKEWQNNGLLLYFGREEIIKQYTRENQTKILAGKINYILA